MREAPEIGGVRCPGVVLLHGIARGSSSLGRLERSLQAAGFATLNIDYASRRKPIAALADDIHPAIARFAEREAPLHFVTHSMGGLVARAYLAKHRPDRLGGVVMLGTPNGGSEVADLLSGSRLYRAFYGPAGLELTTANRSEALPVVDYPVGGSQETVSSIPSPACSSCRNRMTDACRCRARCWPAWPTISS